MSGEEEHMNQLVTVKQIVEQYLTANGYDGLRSFDGECGCKVGDLVPCDGPFDTCEPGYEVPCPGPGCVLAGDCPWHIAPKKPGEEERVSTTADGTHPLTG
jgi:hypothetical protein